RDAHLYPGCYAELSADHRDQPARRQRQSGQGGAQVGDRALLRIVRPQGAGEVGPLQGVVVQREQGQQTLGAQGKGDGPAPQPDGTAVEKLQPASGLVILSPGTSSVFALVAP